MKREGENIYYYGIFSFVQNVFKILSCDLKSSGLCSKNLTTKSLVLTTLKQTAFENIMLQGKMLATRHFLLFSQGFSTLSKREIIILATLNFSSENDFNLDKNKILLFGLVLNVYQRKYLNVYIVSRKDIISKSQ